MPSPFPGMDPYLEHSAYWSGLHTRLIVALGSTISRSLPDGYYADIEQHVWIEDEEQDERRPFAIPDAFIAESGDHGGGSVATLPVSVSGLEVTLAAKMSRARRSKFLRIVDQPGNRVVTVIELPSPSNKCSGPDREMYLMKRNEVLFGGLNLVEIDLIREGERMPFGRPKPPLADYYILIARASTYPKARVIPLSVRDPLPTIAIPLKPKDADVPLDLKAAFDRAYDDGAYETRINYSQPPQLGLRKPDDQWASELIGRVHRTTP